jgi:DNA G:T-mismatch repair endonuclease
VNGCFWHGHGVTLNILGRAKRQSRAKNETLNIDNSECCKIPNTNREFWVAKIRRNKERDKEEQRKLAEMGWHCITVWECELKPKVREQTLDSIAFTLNHIWMQDHQVVRKPYPELEEEEGLLKAAEEEI